MIEEAAQEDILYLAKEFSLALSEMINSIKLRKFGDTSQGDKFLFDHLFLVKFSQRLVTFSQYSR